MKQYTTKQIADALGISRKSLIEKAKREGWIYTESSNGMKFPENRLPLDVRMVVVESQTAAAVPSVIERQEQGTALYSQVSDNERTLATYKSILIYEAQRAKASGLNLFDFVDSYNNGDSLPHVFDKLGAISAKTLYRWIAEFKKNGASGLVRQYGLVRAGSGASLTDIERYYLEYFYLQTSLPTIKYSYLMMRENFPDSICSYATALRYLKSLPKPLVDYKRLGVTKAESLHQPHISQDYSRYMSMEKVVSDHHCLDCVIKYRDKLIRPWITVFQDFRSGKIVGWCPSIAPSSLSILAAYYMMGMTYGIPDLCLFDNGKDYRSKLINGFDEKFTIYLPNGLSEEETIHIKGALPMLGSKIQFTQVYRGQSKGRLERTFGILADYLSKPSGAYIGHDTTSRPEEVQTYYRAINKKAQRTDFPDWDWLVSSMGAIINYINDAMPSQGKGMDGKTRTQVFEENYVAKKIVDDETLFLALTRPSKRTVRKSQVRIGKSDYYAQELFLYNGRDVIVRQQLNRDDEVIVTDARGRVICRAVRDATAEGVSLAETIERVGHMKKMNLKQLAELGTKENMPAPEYDTMIGVAGKIYSQNDFIDFKDPIAEIEDEKLAAGAEHKKVSSKKKENKYKSPLEANEEDYV